MTAVSRAGCLFGFALLGLLAAPIAGRNPGEAARAAEPYCVAPADPPHAVVPGPRPAAGKGAAALAALPKTEWLLHKSADGAHPDGNEQQLLWLLNRARFAPLQEGDWLATTTIPDIADPREYFGVDSALLRREFAGRVRKPPAAFDARLHAAALAHTRDLIARDAQDHAGQLDRVGEAGFRWRAFRGNVLSCATGPENAHGAFTIDWGRDNPDDGDGMQSGRKHRIAVMSLDEDYPNVGIAVLVDDNVGASGGPFVVTEDFCAADNSVDDHFNRFIVGTVWKDLNGNGRYEAGEGIGGVTVWPDAGHYYAVTAAGGGYAIPVAADCTFQVTFSGPAAAVRTVAVVGVSVLLDLEVGAQVQGGAADAPGSDR